MKKKTVTVSEVQTLRMVAGGERRHPVVILGDRRHRWVGFGWVDEGKATTLDRKHYPKVVDDPGAATGRRV